jgi:hypothetical protein
MFRRKITLTFNGLHCIIYQKTKLFNVYINQCIHTYILVKVPYIVIM